MKPQIFSLLILILFSCCKSEKDEKLSISPTVNSSNKLRLDGYYYRENSSTPVMYRVIIFYKNGLILRIGDFYTFNEIETYILSNDLKNNIQENKSFHGLYLIEGSNLKVDKWYNPSMKYYVAHYSGVINSDTSFTFNLYSNSINGIDNTENETYQFKQFSPLPDPSSSFIP